MAKLAINHPSTLDSVERQKEISGRVIQAFYEMKDEFYKAALEDNSKAKIYHDLVRTIIALKFYTTKSDDELSKIQNVSTRIQYAIILYNELIDSMAGY